MEPGVDNVSRIVAPRVRAQPAPADRIAHSTQFLYPFPVRLFSGIRALTTFRHSSTTSNFFSNSSLMIRVSLFAYSPGGSILINAWSGFPGRGSSITTKRAPPSPWAISSMSSTSAIANASTLLSSTTFLSRPSLTQRTDIPRLRGSRRSLIGIADGRSSFFSQSTCVRCRISRSTFTALHPRPGSLPVPPPVLLPDLPAIRLRSSGVLLLVSSHPGRRSTRRFRLPGTPPPPLRHSRSNTG